MQHKLNKLNDNPFLLCPCMYFEYAEVLAAGRNAAERLRACRVAHFARQTALFCPAAVAVHDDGNVPRERVVVFHDKSLSRQKPPSGGF